MVNFEIWKLNIFRSLWGMNMTVIFSWPFSTKLSQNFKNFFLKR